LALVVGPHTAEAMSWITSLAEGHESRIATLSASSLLQVGTDLVSLRRWLLVQGEQQDSAFIVLVRPTEWFKTDGASHLPGLLRQVVHRCQWNRPPSAGALTFISILSAPPSHTWQNAFEEVIPLEFELGSVQATKGYKQFSSEVEASVDTMTSCLEVKDWLRGVLKASTTSSSKGKGIPHAIGLVGPSGSGKSSFLAALKSLPIQVLPMSIPLLINAGVGDTHLAVRNHFERAQLLQPSCITLDDADELFRGVNQDTTCWNHGVSDLLAELVQMLDTFCSPRLVFITTCCHQEMIPPVLACRLRWIQLTESNA